MGYTAELAVSDDHLIVAQRVYQTPTDHESLSAMTEAVERECDERECGERPAAVLADCGYRKTEQLAALEALLSRGFRAARWLGSWRESRKRHAT